MTATLSECNETLEGEHLYVPYTIKFHDRIQKVNVAFRLGDQVVMFAFMGEIARSENRKTIRSMVETYINSRLRDSVAEGSAI